jgi:hypothetical protein
MAHYYARGGIDHLSNTAVVPEMNLDFLISCLNIKICCIKGPTTGHWKVTYIATADSNVFDANDDIVRLNQLRDYPVFYPCILRAIQDD